VRGTLKSNAARLSTELVLLGSSGMLRDYARGVCLEEAERFPGARNERFELDAERNALRISREEFVALASDDAAAPGEPPANVR
jgi:hypothetical protein